MASFSRSQPISELQASCNRTALILMSATIYTCSMQACVSAAPEGPSGIYSHFVYFFFFQKCMHKLVVMPIKNTESINDFKFWKLAEKCVCPQTPLSFLPAAGKQRQDNFLNINCSVYSWLAVAYTVDLLIRFTVNLSLCSDHEQTPVCTQCSHLSSLLLNLTRTISTINFVTESYAPDLMETSD